MRKARRRRHGPYEQLSFALQTAPPPVTVVEHMAIGHFLGIRHSDGRWHLTVALPKHSYLVNEHTPQRWWAESARGEFTLHGWCKAGCHVVTERDDEDSPPVAIDLRATAMRYLRAFNEAFQTWRMASVY